MKKEIIKILNSKVSLSHAIEQNVILEQDFNSLADDMIELITKQYINKTSENKIERIKTIISTWFFDRQGIELNDIYVNALAMKIIKE